LGFKEQNPTTFIMTTHPLIVRLTLRQAQGAAASCMLGLSNHHNEVPS